MSYQVLARKYRPRTFQELVGQEHVSRALVHALDQDRLHHAYLFTGTRGVGKTTIARILSRCLNCEQGVSAQPCGTCDTCVEIGEGRFVDLIEVDAASRTKVEDTRELLDNVQYAPTRGRYKVYLIDEVHMLSAHSFNALLKTLEEPPPHVKFLLATTDPQKLPVTILSRCLQFNLKALPAEQIAGHLKALLDQEMIRYEEPALLLLGRAARGSMRDALSLTDQAIAFGGEQLSEDAVRAMLGTVDREHVYNLLASLVSGEPAAVLDALALVAEQAPDETELLDEMISSLHEVAICQAVPGRSSEARLTELAGQFRQAGLTAAPGNGLADSHLVQAADHFIQQLGFIRCLLRHQRQCIQHRRRLTGNQRGQQVVDVLTVHRTKHGAHSVLAELLTAKGDGLVSERQCIPHGATRCPPEQEQGRLFVANHFLVEQCLQVASDLLRRQGLQVELQAA